MTLNSRPMSSISTHTTGSLREAVLAALRQAPGALTIPEIAEAVPCAAITVRRHIRNLKAAGAVIYVGRRSRQTVTPDGRPHDLDGRGHDQYAVRVETLLPEAP